MGIFSRLKDLELKFTAIGNTNDYLKYMVKYLGDTVSDLIKKNDALSFKIDNPNGLVYFSNISCYDGRIGYKFASNDCITDLTLIEGVSSLHQYKITTAGDRVIRLGLIYKEAGKKYKRNTSDMKEFIIDTENGTSMEVSNLDVDNSIGWTEVVESD